MSTRSPVIREITYRAADGLKLAARHYVACLPKTLRPVICLPGLTRNGRDFHELALALSQTPSEPRDVYTIDLRGRGHSAFDPDWQNYTIPVEMQDVLDFITLMGLSGASVVGTSRGGLIAMLMASVRPNALGPLVLNDIGPVIEREGLGRIAAYVGRIPLPGSWAEAASLTKEMNRRSFPAIADEEWEDIARQWFNERKGRPALGYDTNIAKTFSVLDGPMPALWPQFESLKRVPLLALRGELSDILSAETVAEMRRRHPMFASHTVPQQGHAPYLRDGPTIAVIRRFLAQTEGLVEAPRYAFG